MSQTRAIWDGFPPAAAAAAAGNETIATCTTLLDASCRAFLNAPFQAEHSFGAVLFFKSSSGWSCPLTSQTEEGISVSTKLKIQWEYILSLLPLKASLCSARLNYAALCINPWLPLIMCPCQTREMKQSALLSSHLNDLLQRFLPRSAEGEYEGKRRESHSFQSTVNQGMDHGNGNGFKSTKEKITL